MQPLYEGCTTNKKRKEMKKYNWLKALDLTVLGTSVGVSLIGHADLGVAGIGIYLTGLVLQNTKES